MLVREVERGGCPEEGTPFTCEYVIVCSRCEREVASGIVASLEFLLLKACGAEKQNKALKARIGILGQEIKAVERRALRVGCSHGEAM